VFSSVFPRQRTPAMTTADFHPIETALDVEPDTIAELMLDDGTVVRATWRAAKAAEDCPIIGALAWWPEDGRGCLGLMAPFAWRPINNEMPPPPIPDEQAEMQPFIRSRH
jgi:hypothetical protein